jgi:hypothetical protein
MSDLYDSDLARWAAELRRRAGGNDTAIDWLNVAEEIEAMGRSDRREIHNGLAMICAPLYIIRRQGNVASQDRISYCPHMVFNRGQEWLRLRSSAHYEKRGGSHAAARSKCPTERHPPQASTGTQRTSLSP